MASLSVEQWIIAILSILFSPYVAFFFLIICLAAARKSFGVTKLYIRILLRIFEWGKHRINLHERGKYENNEEENCEDLDLFEKGDGFDIPGENGVKRPIPNNVSNIHKISHTRSLEDMQCGFQLTDAMYFCQKGMEVIVHDTVTQRFDAAEIENILCQPYWELVEFLELPSWNLLTRTNTHYEFISWRLTFLWGLGCVLRLLILFPFRANLAIFAITSMVIGTAFIGFLPDGKLKRTLNVWLSITCYRIFSRAFSAVITFHNRENRASGGGICVANHTSPIDIIVLGCDNCYAMVGQSQDGFMGFMQRTMQRSEHHIWFQRSEVKDRLAVMQRLKEHVEDVDKLPILIFPEGTCINNTSIMMFKKGSFEVGGTIYPVAIKYDPRFADPFWNSSQQTLCRHLLNILTSWALVCDVWYLPPQHKQEDESVIQFTNRVKSEIARQGGLIDLHWDGQLKREKPKVSFLLQQQEEYSKRIKRE